MRRLWYFTILCLSFLVSVPVYAFEITNPSPEGRIEIYRLMLDQLTTNLFILSKTVSPVTLASSTSYDALGQELPQETGILTSERKSSNLGILEAHAAELPLIEVLSGYATSTANKYGISLPLFSRIINCESDWDPEAKNQKDTDGLPAYGILQFKLGTFSGAGGKDIWNPFEQMDIGARLMSQGLYRKWPTCYLEAQKYLRAHSPDLVSSGG